MVALRAPRTERIHRRRWVRGEPFDESGSSELPPSDHPVDHPVSLSSAIDATGAEFIVNGFELLTV